MITVELAPAYAWDCEECGWENFQRPAFYCEGEGDGRDPCQTTHLGAPRNQSSPARGMVFATYPNRVTCRHCGKEFVAACGFGEPETE